MRRHGQEGKRVAKEWTVAERFSANLVWFRRRAGLTQQELADRVGMNRAVLGALDQGRRLPRLDTILRLVAGLEVRNCDLVAWVWWDPEAHHHYETPPAIAGRSGTTRPRSRSPATRTCCPAMRRRPSTCRSPTSRRQPTSRWRCLSQDSRR
jgi:DNA-binding XRE family transcriptional regulator